MRRNRSGSRGLRTAFGCFAIAVSACSPETLPAGTADASIPNLPLSASGPAGSPHVTDSAGAGAAAGSPIAAPAGTVPDAGADAAPLTLQYNVIEPNDLSGSAMTADSIPRWAQPGTVTSLRGRVVAADSGAPLDGWVLTNAACSGTGCSFSDADKLYYTQLAGGAFQFDARAQLTLRPDTAFEIAVQGYRSVILAHGPQVPIELENNARPADELPTIYLCRQDASDSDHDGICDDAEARLGTNPQREDTDGDALSDTLELYGHPSSGTSAFYDIYSLGADPRHADIFLAIRYTEKSRLQRAAFALVKDAFERAPRSNPDATTGLRLHILFDDRAITGIDDLDLLNPVWTQFDRLRAKYLGERPYAFHHGLFVKAYGAGDSSGISRDWGASDLLVATAAIGLYGGTDFEQAGTLMHELGHNLGLHHNGYTDENNAPHYMSVMNYSYQFTGIERSSGTALDYARIELGKLDEGHINEHKPFTPAGRTTLSDLATYLNPRVFSQLRVVGEGNYPRVKGSLAGPLDLNRKNGLEGDVAIDLNGNRVTDRYPQTRNDWATLKLGGGPTGLVGDAPVFGVQRVSVDHVDMPPCLGPQALLTTPDATEPSTPEEDVPEDASDWEEEG